MGKGKNLLKEGSVQKLAVTAVQEVMKINKKVTDNLKSNTSKFKDIFSKLQGIDDWQHDVKRGFFKFTLD